MFSFKNFIDPNTQGLLEHIACKANERGMKINAKKTTLMCASASISFTTVVRLALDGQTVTGQDHLKLLGVTLDEDMSFRTHVKTLEARLRSRTWALAKLRKRGLDKDRLVRAYTALIRPLSEYACPAWHSLLTSEQAAFLEQQQTQP